ncbi:metacaspase-1-like isoform X1 [Senna tora]|uniref:Metacaspase-1-like isoform X1 n=1 Tax=Senna tora TaxID=362788 RepID=A0A834SHL6_9FABA|nr:metacaspase-1-like isoform X1 [Senna tora]
MEAMYKCRKCRKGALFNTSTNKHFCYDCQRIKSSHSKICEAKISCRGCRRDCPVCHTINPSSISGHGQSNYKDTSGMGMRLIKSGVRNLKLDDMADNAYNLLNKQRSSSFSSIGSSFLSRRHNKRAVLCGVTYRKRKFRLKGTVNDVINMKELLVKVFEFPRECIRVLTEQERSPDSIPTKKNILDSLKWLVEGCQPGDSLVFYFSGHGLQHADFKEDEVDGMDESICPVDFVQEGVILDNDINSILVWPLKQGITLHAIVDACHSGTILDLTYVYDSEK